MNIRDRFTRIFHRGKSVYDDICKSKLKSTKLHNTLSRIYWMVLLTVTDVVTREVNGVTAKFHVRSPNEYKRAHSLAGEEEIIVDLLSSINSDDIFYDVGANVGTYSCFVGQKLERGKVIAFEPHPRNINPLRVNMMENSIDGEIRECALDEKTGEIGLTSDSNAAGAGQHSLTESGRSAISVPAYTGDELIGETKLKPPTVLKIDVEGAEMRVLRGLKRVLKNQQVRLIYIEIHPDKISEFGDEKESVLSFLTDSGYDIRKIGERKGDIFLRAESI
ncbi:FkbM family methyltransferase [Natronorubrum sp. DTA7]|uniref:FkbM family methyltransferase n=1 Tax=Natronorubrum sp. DTA7 TaxID=3447016 RepID=UPI003F83ABE7